MRRGTVAYTALALVGFGLAGCGLYRFEQRAAWRNEAEAACISQKLVQPTAYMSRMSAIDGPGACGMNYPFKVAAFAGGSVGLTSNVTLACPIIPTIDAWLAEVVQPAAALYFGSAVAEVRSGSYSCRSRNGQRGAKLSEHAFGNALDVMAFRFADGRELAVQKGWRGLQEEQEFLREVFTGACNYFTTVLGPGADAFHYDHFHLDLARHDPRGERHVCKPVLKFTPRLGADGAQGSPPARRQWQPAEPAPLDMEEDDDPFAVSSKPTPRQAYSSAAPAHASMPPRQAPPVYPPQTSTEPPYAPRTAGPPREPMVLQPQLWTGSTIY
ncbi:MAG TPA: extensin family protein [Beijerinckiaceae bacterium]|jgi:hypothetical protein